MYVNKILKSLHTIKCCFPYQFIYTTWISKLQICTYFLLSLCTGTNVSSIFTYVPYHTTSLLGCFAFTNTISIIDYTNTRFCKFILHAGYDYTAWYVHAHHMHGNLQLTLTLWGSVNKYLQQEIFTENYCKCTCTCTCTIYTSM